MQETPIAEAVIANAAQRHMGQVTPNTPIMSRKGTVPWLLPSPVHCPRHTQPATLVAGAQIPSSGRLRRALVGNSGGQLKRPTLEVKWGELGAVIGYLAQHGGFPAGIRIRFGAAGMAR